jgi:hypothetical protein
MRMSEISLFQPISPSAETGFLGEISPIFQEIDG